MTKPKEPEKFPCPSCGAKKAMVERIDSTGRVRHEHEACGYLMIWKPREL